MKQPPKYPRVPHLAPSAAASSDDVVLSPAGCADLLEFDVVVEEKLDGLNAAFWIDDGIPRAGTRGGADTSDRSGERGRMRSWAAANADRLRAELGEDRVLYGEWLRRRHAVPYTALPGLLVGFDIFDVADGFLPPPARDRVLAALGVPSPPTRFAGRLANLKDLGALLGGSAFAPVAAEGLIVRTADGSAPRVAKLIDPAWRGIGTADWDGENLVCAQDSWISDQSSVKHPA